MIDFKKIKKELIPLLEMYAYKEKTDKSCRQYKVYSNGNETLLLKLGVNGYEHYQNKTDETDYGDAIQFILKHNIVGYKRGDVLGRKEYAIIENELKKLGSYEVSIPMFVEKNPEFDISIYKTRNISSKDDLPSSPKSLLIKRRLEVDLSDPDFENSIIYLKSEKGFESLLFLWKNQYSNVLGAQYKYINNNQCIKKFLPNSKRGESIWRTSLTNKTALFVTEDPLDAIAHKQIHKDKSYCYICTGGSITTRQVRIINELKEKHNLPLILGCDNDIAGQITNYKIVNPLVIVSEDKENAVINIIDNNENQKINKQDFNYFVKQNAAKQGIQIELPEKPYKDWNDYLLPKKKTDILSKISKNIEKIKAEKNEFLGLNL